MQKHTKYNGTRVASIDGAGGHVAAAAMSSTGDGDGPMPQGDDGMGSVATSWYLVAVYFLRTACSCAVALAAMMPCISATHTRSELSL
jgi:hypothetical protein